jgi:hypothetical protein
MVSVKHRDSPMEHQQQCVKLKRATLYMIHALEWCCQDFLFLFLFLKECYSRVLANLSTIEDALCLCKPFFSPSS